MFSKYLKFHLPTFKILLLRIAFGLRVRGGIVAVTHDDLLMYRLIHCRLSQAPSVASTLLNIMLKPCYRVVV